ncbi:unnamed protein product, partial [marine sediment metagenome]
YLNYGFKFPDLKTVFITDQEIFGKERNKRYRLTRRKSEPFSTIMDISSGDYVVHIEHGIGTYRGIINLTVKGVKQDYLLIEYAQGDKLYVPVDQFNLVHKYIGIKDKTQNQNLKLKIEEKVLNFELWFFAFRFKFLV